jgi:hypothetical protein
MPLLVRKKLVSADCAHAGEAVNAARATERLAAATSDVRVKMLPNEII